MSIDNAIEEWSEIHLLTLHAMVTTTVALEGGVDSHFATPRAVVVFIAPRRNPTDDNPAKAFTVSRITTAHKDDYLFLRRAWDTLQECCEKENARVGDRPVEFTTVAFVAEGTGMIISRQYSLRKNGEIDHADIDAPTRVALTDLIELCKVGISYGHSYYRPEDHFSPAPVVGHFVPKLRKGWKRVPVKGEPWDVMTSYMAQRPHIFKSGLKPTVLWALRGLL